MEEIFANKTTDKELNCKIYKQSMQLIRKTATQPKSGWKTKTGISPKKEYRNTNIWVADKYIKKCSTSLIREMQSKLQ